MNEYMIQNGSKGLGDTAESTAKAIVVPKQSLNSLTPVVVDDAIALDWSKIASAPLLKPPAELG